jgi:hypothetical protein
MAAKRKQHHTDVGSTPARPDEGGGVRPQEAVAGAHVPTGDSPARSLQTHLETSLTGRKTRRSRVMDIGRVLASASGITLILGVFVFSGIW